MVNIPPKNVRNCKILRFLFWKSKKFIKQKMFLRKNWCEEVTSTSTGNDFLCMKLSPEGWKAGFSNFSTSDDSGTTRNDSLGPPQLSNILILSIFYENHTKNLSKKKFSSLIYIIHKWMGKKRLYSTASKYYYVIVDASSYNTINNYFRCQ